MYINLHLDITYGVPFLVHKNKMRTKKLGVRQDSCVIQFKRGSHALTFMKEYQNYLSNVGLKPSNNYGDPGGAFCYVGNYEEKTTTIQKAKECEFWMGY